MLRFVVFAIVAILATLVEADATAKVASLDCTDPALDTEYGAVLAKMKTCETASGISLVLPMKNAKKLILCEKCPELLEYKLSKEAPLCNVTISNGQEIRLQAELNRLFNQCSTTTATSDSDTDDDGSGATTTTTATPTTAPAVTTATPTTTTPKTKAPASTAPATTAGSSSSSAATGSTDDEDTDDTTAASTPVATKSTNSAASQSSSSRSGAATNNVSQASSAGGSSITTGLIIGVIAGVLAVALIAGIFVFLRRRRRDSDSDKFDSAVLDSSTGRDTVPYQFSLITASSGTGSKSGGSSRPMQSPPVNLWEDPLIVAARVPKDKVVFTTLVSRGGFGEVYMGIYNRQTVAIKMLLPETRKDLEEINAFLAEVKLMATLEHERIVTFIGVAWDSLNDICVLTEYMEGGDLRGAIVHWEEIGRRRGFDNDKVKIALHIAHALTYMHSLRPVVLHRDLKSKNILLDNHLNAKLTDFGVSRERIDQTMTAGVGTSLWMAPEVMMGERYNEKADIFSFGVVLSELSTHDVPYGKVKESGSGHKIPDSAVLQMVSQGRLRVKFTPNSMAEVEELGISCVALNPRDRPTASDVLYTLHNILKCSFVVM
ncbi:Tkl protein kinase, partial [Globisporangium splendens]